LGKEVSLPEVRAKILKTPLFPEFVDYFEAIKRTNKIFFLTGRKFKDYGIETTGQLYELGIDLQNVIFYPDHFKHEVRPYIDFKVFNILKIAYNNQNQKVIAYDDMDIYFCKLMRKIEMFGLENIELRILKDPKKAFKLKLKNLKRGLKESECKITY
jgi:hypothetical protein